MRKGITSADPPGAVITCERVRGRVRVEVRVEIRVEVRVRLARGSDGEGGMGHAACVRACVRACVASVKFSGYPQEVGNEEFLSLMSSHQVPCKQP